MAYLALYREWRPQTFDDIVGQRHITTTLQNAIKASRIAHAYLFCGPRGTGKTTTAKVLAKALNCQGGPAAEPCNQCENCKRITEGISMDVMEIDAASNRGIDEIRDLREKVKYSPTEGSYRIYIVDEVHMLTTEAFNALLKTLEEPPRHVLFILATTEPHKIPTTILSRCQRFDFKRIGLADIAARLADVCNHMQIETDAETLNLLAKTAEGGLRDALSILDQCISFGGNRVSVEEVSAVLGTVNQDLLFEMTEYLINRDSTSALFLVHEIVNQGKDLRQFSKDITEHLRNLLLLQVSDKAGELIPVTEHTLNKLADQAQRTDKDTIMNNINIFSSAEREIKWSNQPRMVVELAVIEACAAPAENNVKELQARLERLEKLLENGAHVAGTENTSRQRGTSLEKAGQGRRGSIARESATREAEAADQKAEAPDQQAHTAEKQRPSTTLEKKPSIGIEEVRQNWPGVMEKIKKVKRTAHAFLIEGKPAEISGNRLIIGFPEEYSFHKENIEKQENRETIEKVLSEVIGMPIHIKCRFFSELHLSNDMVKEEKGDNPIVDKAIQIFGADVVEIND